MTLQHLFIDLATGEEQITPFTAEEEAAADQRVAAGQAAAAADGLATSNTSTMQQLLRVARQTNRDYIALASPTAAQTTAEVKAMARQVNWLIRMVLGDLGDTT